jgi:hypothetical protein
MLLNVDYRGKMPLPLDIGKAIISAALLTNNK